MPDTDSLVLPLHCPNCGHDGAWPRITSKTVLTVRCSECEHGWSIDVGTLSFEIREQVTAATEARFAIG